MIFFSACLVLLGADFTDAYAQTTTDMDKLNYAEIRILLQKYKSVTDTILVDIQSPSLRYYYLLGVCYKYQSKWPEAIENFQKAIDIDPNNERSMIALSYLGLGQSLMAIGDYEKAIEKLNAVIDQYGGKLERDYPKYPSYVDNVDRKLHIIADDAQMLIAECYEKMGPVGEKEALNAYAKVARFYPFSARLSEANEKLGILLNN